jgi:DNA-binding transcriptional ArsR family regulator
MTNRLTPAAAAFIMRLWRNGTVATLNTKNAKKTAVNNSQWLTPEQLPSVSLASNDVYFSTGTATQIPPTNAEGKTCNDRYKRIQNAYLASINALYTEFDFKDFTSAEATIEHVNKLPHPPSIIINSGGGLHCYWLLDATHYCHDESSRERLRRCISAFVTANGGDTGARDLARVLRVPDTLNTKYTPPRPVSFVRCDYTIEYQFDTLEAWALSKCPPPPAHPKRVAISIPTTDPSDKAMARAVKYFNVMLARRCDELLATPAGQRYNAIKKHATAVGGYCHLMPNGSGEQIAHAALLAACAHYDDQPKTQSWIDAALRYGIAHPIDTPDFTAPPKRTPQQTENALQHIDQLRAAIESRQWHGKATITTSTGKTATIKLVSAYRVLSYALDIATEQTYNRVLLSARYIAINTRMRPTRAAHCIQYLRERGYLKEVEAATDNSAGIYRVDICKTATPITHVVSVAVLHRYKSSACSRRVTIVTEHERMIGAGARRRYANAPTLDDCPLDNIKPVADWKGPHLLRSEPTKEYTNYDGLGEMARHVLDLLTGQPYLKRDLATITGASMDTVRRVLTRLKQAEIVVIGDDRRGEATRLSDDWNKALNKFYELGNIAEHQRRIATRCERERLAWRERLDNKTREPMSDDERIADIAQTIAEATLELSPTATATEQTPPPTRAATTSTEPPTVTAVTIASDDERKPTPAPAPTTINVVATWLQRLADVAEDVLAGNPVWIPKREIPASEFDAVRNVATGHNINLIDASATFYQVRAAA